MNKQLPPIIRFVWKLFWSQSPKMWITNNLLHRLLYNFDGKFYVEKKFENGPEMGRMGLRSGLKEFEKWKEKNCNTVL